MKLPGLLISIGFIGLSIVFNSCKKDEIPTLTTSEVTDVTAETANCGGIVIYDGGSMVSERGVCWSLSNNPTIKDNKTSDGAGEGSFTSNLSNLEAATTYYVRAFATNKAGTGYGMEVSFTTQGQAPTTATEVATNVTPTSATLNGVVNANYLSTVVSFEFGTSTSYGQTINAIQSPVSGNSNTNITAEISGLTAGTIYHFRVKTVNSLGTTYGNDMEFTTLGQNPTAITQSACCITTTGATLNGTINANFLSTTVTFEYGTSTTYGNTVQATPSPITGNNPISVSANLSGLSIGTIYHFRIIAMNELGTTFGDDLIFTTVAATAIDIDGNVYNVITIGKQSWLLENLKTTTYNNGDPIPTTTVDISTEINPKYQWAYDYNENNVEFYGRLYTWYAATDSRGVCPVGFHIPSNDEFIILEEYLTNNGYGYEGSGNDIAKAFSIDSGWDISYIPGTAGNNQASNNSSGFSAVPAGAQSVQSWGLAFGQIRRQVCIWTSTAYSDQLNLRAMIKGIYFEKSWIDSSDYPKNWGFSVRCVKD